MKAPIACMICQPRDENSRSCRWWAPGRFWSSCRSEAGGHPEVRWCCLEIGCTLSWVQSSRFPLRCNLSGPGALHCVWLGNNNAFGPRLTLQCLFPWSWGQSFVCRVLFPSLLIVTCLCFTVCPWGNKLLRASAPQAERESSAAVGGPGGQQELYAPGVAAVFSVSSAKQCNKGNACHVLCVSVRPGGRAGAWESRGPRGRAEACKCSS